MQENSTAENLQLFIQELEELEDLATDVVKVYFEEGDSANFKAELQKLAIFLEDG